MRSGVMLTELLIGLVVAGIVASIAIPGLVRLSDAAAVRDEMLRVVAGIDAARGAAVRLNQAASLALSPADYRVVVVTGADTVIAWTQSGPGLRGVILTGAGQPLRFGPAGLGMGVSNRTITVSKGTATRTVVVSQLGRVTY